MDKILNRRQAREAKITSDSITQPDLALSVAEIIDRIQRGQEVPQQQPIYFGEKLQELTGFENLSKLEQIDFARSYSKHAKETYHKEEQEAIAKYNTEKEAAEAKVKAADVIIEK